MSLTASDLSESEDYQIHTHDCGCGLCALDKDNDTSHPVAPTDSGTNNNASAVIASGNQLIDGVLIGQQWAGGTIDYAYSLTSAPYAAYTDTDLVDIAQNMTVLAAQQETVINFILDAETGPSVTLGFSVEGFTNLTVNNLGNVDDNDAHIRLGNTTSSQLNTARVADFPGDLITSNVSDDGDVWFGPYNNNVFLNPVAGNYAWATHIHEIGHALGLAHGHTGFLSGALPSNYDAMEYSIMTYRSYLNGPTNGYSNETWGYAQTFMMSDIAALQYMYGADFTANSGDTVYSWNPSSGDTLIDGVVAINPGGNRIFATIWDGDGNDTYDLSAYTTDLQIDLSPGGFSLFSAVQQANLGSGNLAQGNIYNAWQYQGDARSLIENAIGGSGDDLFSGNAADNTLNGGLGIDTVSFDGEDMVTVDLQAETATGSSIGSDNLISIENVSGTVFGDMLTGSNIDNVISGNFGADTINGADGNDTLYGGGDIDTLNGGTGNDTLYGGNNAGVSEAPESGISFGSGQFSRQSDAGNDSIANAIDISALFSLDADADIIDATTIPHVSITATGDATTSVHYYEVNLTAIGTVITLDVDYGTEGGNMDSWIELYDASGNLVAFDDDSSTADGAGGSTSGLDSFLSYTTQTAGLFYFAVGTYSGLSDIPIGGTYELQVSVQENAGEGEVQVDNSADILDGGIGNDTLYGEAGDDTLTGGVGADMLYGGAGDDIVNADSDDITFNGGEGTDTLNLTYEYFFSGDFTDLGFEIAAVTKADGTLIQTFGILSNGIERTTFIDSANSQFNSDLDFSLKIIDQDEADANNEWFSRTQYRDANNAIFQFNYFLDDGTLRVEEFDTDSSDAWSERVTLKDGFYATTSIFTLFDNTDTELETFDVVGAFDWGRSLVRTDVSGTKAYSTLTAFYLDGTDALDLVIQELDSGNRLTTDYDAANTENFALSLFTEDANNDELFTSVLQLRNDANEITRFVNSYDNALEVTIDFDVDDSESWFRKVANVDNSADGSLLNYQTAEIFQNAALQNYGSDVLGDDGVRTITDNDLDDVNTWAMQRTRTDEGDNFSWGTIIDQRDASGNILYLSQTNDGSYDTINVYDVAGTEVWARTLTYVDDEGQYDFATRTYFYDDAGEIYDIVDVADGMGQVKELLVIRDYC